jgi:hypothetical protein
MLTSLQTTLAAEVHLAERQFLLQKQIPNTEKSLKGYHAATQRTTISKREGQKLEPR